MKEEKEKLIEESIADLKKVKWVSLDGKLPLENILKEFGNILLNKSIEENIDFLEDVLDIIQTKKVIGVIQKKIKENKKYLEEK